MVGFVKAQKKATKCAQPVVDYKKGLMELDWKPGQRFDYAAIKKATTVASDLTLKTVSVIARGSVATVGTNAVLTLSGTGEKFSLDNGGREVLPKLLAALTPGTTVRVTGDIREDKKGAVAALVVTAFEIEQADNK